MKSSSEGGPQTRLFEQEAEATMRIRIGYVTRKDIHAAWTTLHFLSGAQPPGMGHYVLQTDENKKWVLAVFGIYEIQLIMYEMNLVDGAL